MNNKIKPIIKIAKCILIILLIPGCQEGTLGDGQETGTFSFYVGTYTDNYSKGIYKYSLHKDGSLIKDGLAAKTANPAYLALSMEKKYLLAVNEIDNDGSGIVESYLITDDSLVLISRQSSGGAHPCFITLNQHGFILVTNWTGGNVGLLRLNSNGELSALLDVQNHSGHNTGKNQQGPHAHSAWFNSVNNDIISVDLGTNELWFSTLDTLLNKLNPSDPQTLAMKPGAGPRHLAIHPNGQWIYVLNELDCTVTLVHKSEKGDYEKGVSVSTVPQGYSEPNFCADIKISSDGKFVYASNRGHDSIAIFEVNAKDGSLSHVDHEPTRGNWPRNICLSPEEDYLLVANQRGNNIVSFHRDDRTGILQYVTHIGSPSPACIAF
jgi:6-phosphogluconolactonase